MTDFFSVSGLKDSTKKQRIAHLNSIIKQILSEILFLISETIDEDTSFFEMGMESLTAEKFKNELQKKLGDVIQLDTTIVFNYPTTASLSEYIEKTVFSEHNQISPGQMIKSVENKQP